MLTQAPVSEMEPVPVTLRSGTGLDFRLGGLPVDWSLPVDRPITGRAVVTGRPAGYWKTGQLPVYRFHR